MHRCCCHWNRSWCVATLPLALAHMDNLIAQSRVQGQTGKLNPPLSTSRIHLSYYRNCASCRLPIALLDRALHDPLYRCFPQPRLVFIHSLVPNTQQNHCVRWRTWPPAIHEAVEIGDMPCTPSTATFCWPVTRLIQLQELSRKPHAKAALSTRSYKSDDKRGSRGTGRVTSRRYVCAPARPAACRCA